MCMAKCAARTLPLSTPYVLPSSYPLELQGLGESDPPESLGLGDSDPPESQGIEDS